MTSKVSRFRNKVAIFGGSLVLVLSILLPASANAGSSNIARCNPILSGLWTGSNFAVDLNTGCKQAQAAAQSLAQPTSPTGNYVALGDSIAAGIGLSPATANTDPVCGVTDKSYPALVAAQRGMSYQNLACNGATAGDLVTEQHLPDTSRDIEPQLGRAFAGGTPPIITVTAGANDIYWTSFLRKCYVATCGTTFDDTVTATLVSTLRLKLEYDLASINARSNGQPPRVILTGYYQPFSPACIRQQTNITTAEFTWLRAQLRTLNQTIKDTVSGYSFARYAPLDFNNHRLCTTDSWIQGINDPAPFHPTAQGQRAIANSVLTQVQ